MSITRSAPEAMRETALRDTGAKRALRAGPARELDPDGDQPESEPAPFVATARAPKRTVWIGAAALVLLGAIGFVLRLRSSDAPASEDPDAEAARIRHLGILDLDAEFPPGWRVVPVQEASGPAPDPSSVSRVTTSIVYRGGTASDPDQAVFLAGLPLVDDLATGEAIAEPVLLRVIRNAERGTAARVGADGGRYHPAGCAVSHAAHHIAVCRGTAIRGERTTTVETYLRVGTDRAVLALFVAKPTIADATLDAEKIVDSFGL